MLNVISAAGIGAADFGPRTGRLPRPSFARAAGGKNGPRGPLRGGAWLTEVKSNPETLPRPRLNCCGWGCWHRSRSGPPWWPSGKCPSFLRRSCRGQAVAIMHDAFEPVLILEKLPLQIDCLAAWGECRAPLRIRPPLRPCLLSYFSDIGVGSQTQALIIPGSVFYCLPPFPPTATLNEIIKHMSQ